MEESNVWDIDGFKGTSGLEAESGLAAEGGLAAESGLEAEGELAAESGLEAESALAAESGLEAESALAAEGEVEPEGLLGDTSFDCKAVIRRTIEKAGGGDCGAPFEPEALHALLALQVTDFAGWVRVREEFRGANRRIPLTKLDQELTRLAKATRPIRATHNGYAVDALSSLSMGEHRPVAVMGTLYVPRAESSLWMPLDPGELERAIAQKHDGKENCLRHEDYKSIAAHALALATDEAFFDEAPVGVACLRSFFFLRDGAVCQEPLSLKHRQTEALDYEPADLPTPLYDVFMHETFCSNEAGEEVEQRRLVEEFAGAAMLGIAPRFQKAFMWLDRFGRAGKGTLQSIYENLVPLALITAMSPIKWRDQYYMAGLAGKRLNVVGELPEGAPIAAAEFKSVLGGDRVMGRHPTGRPFMFKNEAAHLFMSNYMVQTVEYSESFFSRWLLIEFPNSRTKSGLPLDPSLAENIVRAELPGIAFKALQGAARLVKQGGFSPSRVHDRLMAQWRRSSNSLDEFIHEECELHASYFCNRAGFYAVYKRWCAESGRKALKKSRVKDMLEHNLTLGVRLSSLNGNEVFRGVRLKPDSEVFTELEGFSLDVPAARDQAADF